MANVPIIGENKKHKMWQGTSLRHLGITDYGDNEWRVVWGPSRLYIVGGMWQDHIGTIPNDRELVEAGRDLSLVSRRAEYRWIPKYPTERWILERWLTPFEYAGSPSAYAVEQWDEEAKLLTLGPYPERGEYEGCYVFPEEPTYQQIETDGAMGCHG